jgi:hypothetical protein
MRRTGRVGRANAGGAASSVLVGSSTRNRAATAPPAARTIEVRANWRRVSIPACDASAETTEPTRRPTLQKPWRLDMTERARVFSISTPCAFIAMSARPAVAPKTSRATHNRTSDVGSVVRTRLAQNATIVAVTNGRNA